MQTSIINLLLAVPIYLGTILLGISYTIAVLLISIGKGMKNYIHRNLNCLSQLVNNLVWPGAHPDECISGRVHREYHLRVEKIIDTICFWDKAHCRESYEGDLSNAGKIMARHRERLKDEQKSSR
jgi:hypothetical protein